MYPEIRSEHQQQQQQQQQQVKAIISLCNPAHGTCSRQNANPHCMLVCRALLTDLSSHPPLLQFRMICNHLSVSHPGCGQPPAHALRSPRMPLHSTDTPDLVTVVWKPAWVWPTLRGRAQRLQAVGNSATLTGSFALEHSTMAQLFLGYSLSWPWGSSIGQ